MTKQTKAAPAAKAGKVAKVASAVAVPTVPAPVAAVEVEAVPAVPAVEPAPAPRVLSQVPGHVLVTSDVLSVVFRTPRGGRPAEMGLRVASFAAQAQDSAERANDWSRFYADLVGRLLNGGFELAADFTWGHSVGIELGRASVEFSVSYAPKGSDLDNAETRTIGPVHRFRAFCESFLFEQDVLPVDPAIAHEEQARRERAEQRERDAEYAGEARAARAGERQVRAARVAPPRAVAAAPAPAPASGEPDRLVRAKQQLRATLKVAKAAA